jgi:hypothetical protein
MRTSIPTISRMAMLLSATLYSLCFSINSQASAPLPADNLDYSRLKAENGMVFVPYLNASRGPVWYFNYQQKILGPSVVSTKAKKLYVVLMPQVIEQRNAEYLAFIGSDDVDDARVHYYPGYTSLCSISPALILKLKEIYNPVGSTRDYFTATIVNDGYPSLCRLEVNYLNDQNAATPDAEALLLAYVKENIIINSLARTTIPYGYETVERLEYGDVGISSLQINTTVKNGDVVPPVVPAH